LKVIGAPEEIRTPDPQIRRLVQQPKKLGLFSKPPKFSALKYQWVTARFANRKADSIRSGIHITFSHFNRDLAFHESCKSVAEEGLLTLKGGDGLIVHGWRGF